MPESQPRQWFVVGFSGPDAAAAFLCRMKGGTVLKEHDYKIVACAPGNCGDYHVDIAVVNGGGEVNLDVLVAYAGKFPGYMSCRKDTK